MHLNHADFQKHRKCSSYSKITSNYMIFNYLIDKGIFSNIYFIKFLEFFWHFLKRNAIFCTPFDLFSVLLHLRPNQNSNASKRGSGSSWRLCEVQLMCFIMQVWMSWNAPHCIITAKKHKKTGTSAEAHIKLWGCWQKWRPTALRRGSWSPWRAHNLQFRGSTSLSNVLARFSVIF